MILVLGGTSEGRQAAVALQEKGYAVMAATVSAYGGELAAQSGIGERSVGALNFTDLYNLIQEKKIRLVVDATHPFAREIKEIAREACEMAKIPYLRFARREADLPESLLIHEVETLQEAVQASLNLGETIFLTIGSKHLPLFAQAAQAVGKRVIARVLPDPEVLADCLYLGLSPKDIIAMQGPFSRETNRALYKEFGADVVVSKDSGERGGTLAKVEAALDLGLPVVLIRRPQEAEKAVGGIEELLSRVGEVIRDARLRD